QRPHRAAAAPDPALAARPRRHRHLADDPDPGLLVHPDRRSAQSGEAGRLMQPRLQPWRPAKAGLLLAVRVSPKAYRDGIDGLAETSEGPALQGRVRAVPDQGEANTAVETVVAKWLGVAATKVAVTRGHKSRVKMLEIGGEPAMLEALIAARVEALD